MKKKIVAVADITRYVARLLDEDYVLTDVWVAGEISNCKYHHTGHIYFTLKDQKASIQSVMFAKDAAKLDFKLEEGMKVNTRCRISLYEKTGTFQAYVLEAEKEGKGTLYEAFEKMKQKLYQEGLFDASYKKPIPAFPNAVAVITSHTGAAIKDILQVAKRRHPGIPVYIYPVHVQGSLAAGEMIQALEQANQDGLCDVIIIGRGGGSIEDLWAFNEEALARAIFTSALPVVSAVGHEVDFTISDFVSDLRAATPSQAAEIVFPHQAEYERRILRYKENLVYALREALNRKNSKLKALVERPVFTHKNRYFEEKMLELDDYLIRLEESYTSSLKEKIQVLDKKITQLDTLSPLRTLQRGYSLASSEKDKKLLTTTKEIEEGDTIRITLSDGYVVSTVIEKG